MNMVRNNGYLWDIDNPLGYNNKMGYYKTKKEYEFILHHLKHDNLRILDVGGGSGRFAHPLAVRGHDLTIVDKSAPAMECLKKRNNSKIKFICNDFMGCAIDESSYDVVIAMESVYYFDEMEKLFMKINQALLPDGIFIFSELNKRSWRYYFHKKLRKEKINYSVKSAEDYTLALNLTGFEVNDIEGFMWIPLTVNSDSVLVDLFAFIESLLGLHKWVDQSPWLLFAAHKKLRT
jgi:2-polyprenyl-3-methyl-5-hydroxy-6-metoxy-1,4-benzoquinol methylase